MFYALICTDKLDRLAVAKAKRPEHVEYIKGFGGTMLAGPFTGAGGETMNGSLIVIEAVRSMRCPRSPLVTSSRKSAC
jgi:uncharacterized protein